MHHLIFGHSFAGLVAPILLFGLAFHFLNKKRTSVRRIAEDAITGASDLLTVSTETNSGGSSLSLTETNGASNSSAMATGNCYEVFLSFRGLDTRKGFTDHLYTRLVDAGIHAFKDDNELCHGKKIGPDLLTAIKNSKILIPIISLNYGSSSWCLNELVQIMECQNSNIGHLVLPIFYKVEPTHVRHQIGSFGDVFRMHERHSDQVILEKWKLALSEVSFLKGWEANGYEGKLVKSVVQKVLNELKKEFELVIPDNLVGIDSHVKNVMEFLDNNSSATLFVGIHGMGGIGKTTLAKTIYNKLSSKFEYCSFVTDIRESCKRNGLECLQNKLISDILKQKNQVYSKDEGTRFLSSKFEDKKVLILLDDADDDDQLKALAGNHNWFSPGSRILITTRNKAILDNAAVDFNYEHEEIDGDQSLILFSRHAFRRNCPPSEFKDLAHEVVSTTGGLPLSLEVLGSLLCGKRPTQWRGTIKKLKKVPNRKVLEKLRISYDVLENGQKEIFLDIACFFIGTDERIASYMWDACEFFPEEAIEVLRFMSLIKVGVNHELRMHDQLRDLGREIVREENQQEPWYRSRLWESKEIQKVLKGNKGTEKIRAIYLNKGSSEDFGETPEHAGDILTSEQFKNLTRLRFLHVNGAHFSGDFKNSIEELRWLQWQNCPLTFEAENIHLKELVALDLSKSKISDKWGGWNSIMMAEELKFLDLTRCSSLEGTFFLSAFKNLEVLILKGCWRLEQIDSSIGDMKSMVCLDLTGCISLKELPLEVGKLKALEQLLLQGCQNISVVPDEIGALKNLEILNISGTGIKDLPYGIGKLRNLRILDASGCYKLGGKMSETESIRSLSSLPRPHFHGYRRLQLLLELPSSLTCLSITCQSRRLPSLSHLNHLKELRLLDCEYLECIWELRSMLLQHSECSRQTDVEESELQKSPYDPFKLEILEIRGCKFMKTLDVSQSNHLRTLSAEGCDNILEVRGLDKLKYLESLGITGCTSIKRLDLPNSEGMKKIHAEDCENLVKIKGLDRLKFLKVLYISKCPSIERPKLSNSEGMKKLQAEYCKNLVEIQGLDKLEFLEELHISRCASIERLYLPVSKGLKILNVKNCEKLIEIQGVDGLEFLKMLCIFGCTSIERLNLPKSEGLKILNAKNCEKLVEIQGFDRIEFLEELYISRCTSIERVDLSKSKGIKKLHAEYCRKLVEIQGLDLLESLEDLNIFQCASIGRLELPKSEGMKKLHAEYCENLVEIQGLDRLEFLEELYISQCTSIEMLNLPKSKGLKILDAENCKDLVKIQGLDRLEFLKKLCISGCTSIERLDLPKSKSMMTLFAKNCEDLVEIQGLDRLEFLELLYISRCASLERLDLAKSKGLRKLVVKNCRNLVEIQGLDRMEFLEELYIFECASIERLDLPKFEGLPENWEELVEIHHLGKLELLKGSLPSHRHPLLAPLKFEGMKILCAKNCKSLVKIQGLDKLEFLELLYISQCTSIERLDLPKFEQLKILNAEDCENLVKIQGIDRLKFLEGLYISGCASIKRLNLPNSESLEILYAQNCKNLVQIQGLDRLKFLKELDISRCASIERLDLSKSECLKILNVRYCKNLVKIQGFNRLELLKELYIIGCASIKKLDLSKSKGLNILDAQYCENLVEIQDLDGLEFLKC